MRKSCAQFVASLRAFCGRTHDLYAHCPASVTVGGDDLAVIPPSARIHVGRLCTIKTNHFAPVNWQLFPTIHTTNNNYYSVYIGI
jgi:hypothetical protein